MATPRDLLGRWVETPLGPIRPANTATIQNNAQQLRAVRVFGSNAATDAQPLGAPWTFTQLAFIEKYVTICPLGGSGTLTGWMSGCFVCKFTVNGAAHVAHIGTDVADPVATAAVKAAWIAHVGAVADDQSVFGCDILAAADLSSTSGHSLTGFMPQIAAWIDPGGALGITIFGTPQGHMMGNANPSRYKVLAFQPANWTPWSALINNPKFQ